MGTSNVITKIDEGAGSGVGDVAIDGWKYVNGHKWYHIKEYGGTYINDISLRKPVLYTANSNVTIYDVEPNDDGTGEVCYEPKTTIKKGTTIGKFSY